MCYFTFPFTFTFTFYSQIHRENVLFPVRQSRLHGTDLRDCGLRGPELPDRRPQGPLLQRGPLGRLHHVQGLRTEAGEGHQEVGGRKAKGNGAPQRGQDQGALVVVVFRDT